MLKMASLESTASGEHLYDKLNPTQTQESVLRQGMPHILTPVPVHPSSSRSASASAATAPLHGWSSLKLLPPRNVFRIPLPTRSSSVHYDGNRPAAITVHPLAEGMREETLDERSLETTGSIDSVKYARVERNRSDGETRSEKREYVGLQLQGLAPSNHYTSPSAKRKSTESPEDGTESTLTPASSSSSKHNTPDREASKKRAGRVAGVMERSGLRAADCVSGSLALLSLTVALLATPLAIYSYVNLSSDQCAQYAQCSEETQLLVHLLQEQLDTLQKEFNEFKKLSLPLALTNCTSVAFHGCCNVSQVNCSYNAI